MLPEGPEGTFHLRTILGCSSLFISFMCLLTPSEPNHVPFLPHGPSSPESFHEPCPSLTDCQISKTMTVNSKDIYFKLYMCKVESSEDLKECVFSNHEILHMYKANTKAVKRQSMSRQYLLCIKNNHCHWIRFLSRFS